MPYNDTPPSWRTRSHPLNSLLHNLGSGGGQPTRAELAAVPGGPVTHEAVKQAARTINRYRDCGDFQAAREHAEATLGRLGPAIERTPLPEPEPVAEPASLDDLATRMFHN